MARNPTNSSGQIIGSVRHGIDLVTAVLLLTGQITTTGIFVVPEGFYLASGGPIFGGVRSSGTSAPATVVLSAVDVLAAVLLILQAIRVTGVYITSQRFFIVFSGPIFGIKEVVGAVSPRDMQNPQLTAMKRYIRQRLVKR